MVVVSEVLNRPKLITYMYFTILSIIFYLTTLYTSRTGSTGIVVASGVHLIILKLPVLDLV